MWDNEPKFSILTAFELEQHHQRRAKLVALHGGVPFTMQRWLDAKGYMEVIGAFGSPFARFVDKLVSSYVLTGENAGVTETYGVADLEPHGFRDWDDFEGKFADLAKGYAWKDAVTIEVAIDREAGSATVTYRVRAS
jgi:hypothetical protein